MKTLVILESGSKVKKVQSYLGSDYVVKACFGHIRDIDGKSCNIDIENDFAPNYTLNGDKKSIVADLKGAYKKCKRVLLATDLDREGEAIAYHIAEALHIKPKDRHRLIFSEITKTAIQKAVETPVPLNMNIFYAQQARRVLDRLIGYTISPILWKHIQNSYDKKLSLSAGRVQSVVLKLIIEREKDIAKFSSTRAFRVDAEFGNIKAILNQELEDKATAIELLEDSKDAEFTITDITNKKTTRKPPPPFITSTMQQEASSKFNMSPKGTMASAQKLYENGYITYMRTDSLSLSTDAIGMIKSHIIANYGEPYLCLKQYKNKDGNCQEAHEAIRPCNIQCEDIADNINIGPYENKLYKLIWRRTVASQMSPAKIELINVKIDISPYEELLFIAKAEKVLFDGFQRLVATVTPTPAADDATDAGVLAKLKKGGKLTYTQITATEKISKPKHLRYTEASLIKKLDDLDIGRPSTYASMVSVVQDRKYVDKLDIEGRETTISIETLSNSTGEIVGTEQKTTTGGEKQKLVPNEIGDIVNDFMSEHFTAIINYTFTSSLEKKLDEISAGDASWVDIVRECYNTFNPICTELKQKVVSKDIRTIGIDTETDITYTCYVGKYGPVVAAAAKAKAKPRYSPLGKYKLADITIEEAIGLFRYPQKLTAEITIKKGKYGLYFEHGEKRYTLKDVSEDDITEEKCKEIITASGVGGGSNIIKEFGKDLVIRKGPYGPYINYKNKNYKVFDKNPEKLTKERCMEIIQKKK
jgi:DNA topoisomerase I